MLCKAFCFPQRGHHILCLLNSCPIRFEIVTNNSVLSFLLGRHFTATYKSLLGGFPASKFSFVSFNPDKGESKKAALKLFIQQKTLEEAANVQFPPRKDYFNDAFLVADSFSIRLAYNSQLSMPAINQAVRQLR